MEPAVVCRGVSKHFRKRAQRDSGRTSRASGFSLARSEVVKAVDSVDFSVAGGEVFGILGCNGSGKSTLIRLISTLLLPDAGDIAVFGCDVVRERMAVRRLINRVSVEASFYKKLSARENLMYAARLYGVSPADADARARHILGELGFPAGRMNDSMTDLSRGMQQKVAIARAFLSSPILLLLDEPTTGLDPRSKRDVQRFIRYLVESHDATVILTTHDMDEADALCDRVAFIDEGRFVAVGAPAEHKARGGGVASLEEVFIDLTGHGLEEEQR